MINDIIQKHPDAVRWHQSHPWFPVGRAVHAHQQKDQHKFIVASQKAAVYFNDVQRLHWLLFQKPFDKAQIISQFKLNTAENVAANIGSAENLNEFAKEVTIVETPSVTGKETLPLFEAGEIDQMPLPKTSSIIDGEQGVDNISQKEAVFVATKTDEDAATPYDPDDTDGVETEQEEPELVSVSDIGNDPLPSAALHTSLAEVSKQFKDENQGKEDELKIESEPYHTVDYFASQGIKLVLEPNKDDKFGQQLKSFTSWLKQMKRVPGTKMAEKEADPLVDAIASSSLEQGEVLTESMAEVLWKQGKTKQAVEVWHKLQAQHPEKKEYYQTLINQQP